eukprot:783048_1
MADSIDPIDKIFPPNARVQLDTVGTHAPRHVVKMAAPMVRYSKLPFRMLCRKWGCDVAFTPMIIASAFNRSQSARDADFSTAEGDRPLVVQFAANDPVELGLAAIKSQSYVDAIDLNCGCPQKWAVEEKLGGYLSGKPQLVKEMVCETKKHTNLPVSIKIRIQDDIRHSVDLVRQAEAAGVAWVTVHGRTVSERTRSTVHLDAIKTIKDHASVPVVANGDIFTLSDIDRVVQETGVGGVMSARGILANPAMFSGHPGVPLDCLIDYINLALAYGGVFRMHHQILSYMLCPKLSKSDRAEFSRIRSFAGIIDFFERHDWWPPRVDSD